MQETKSHSSTEGYGNEEVDLKKLFSSINDFFFRILKSFIKQLIGFRKATKKYRLLIFGSIILFLILGYYFHSKTPKYYKATMLISAEYFKEVLVDNMVEKINLLASEGNTKALATLLNITEEVAQEIKGLEVLPTLTEEEKIKFELLKEQLRNAKISIDEQEEILKKIKLKDNRIYEIILLTFDNKVISGLENPLYNYFRKNRFIEKRINGKERDLLARKEKLENEMVKIDSLKSALYHNLKNANISREGSNNIIMSEIGLKNPLEIYTKDLEFHTQKIDIENALFLRNDFELIEGLTAYNEPATPKLSTILMYAFLISMVTSYIIIGSLEFNSYLTKVERDGF